MTPTFKMKLAAGLFVPTIALAGAASAQTDKARMDSKATMDNKAATGTTHATPANANFTWDGKTFDRLDTNRDGMLSRDEVQGDMTMREHWTKLDREGKGNVSRVQFEEFGRGLNPNSAYPKGHPFDPATKDASKK